MTQSYTHRAEGAPTIKAPAFLRRAAVVAGGTAVAAGSVVGVGAASASADSGVWDRVAACESGGNWSIASGNGYYGGLQFSASTWRAYGGTEYASTANKASKSQQITVAKRVLEGQGPGAWPVCSKKAGLTRSNGGAASSSSDEAPQSEKTEAPKSEKKSESKKSTKSEKSESKKSTTSDKTESKKSTKSEKSESKKSTTSDKSESKKSTTSDKSESKKSTKSEKSESKKSTSTKAASTGDLAVDGKFGDDTTAAVQQWVGMPQGGELDKADIATVQRWVGANDDGVIGTETTLEVQKAIGMTPNGASDFTQDADTVRQLQSFLNAQG
ncbi:transglycosylase family protein [Brachybacterium nesterenkovii]|uniref:transglycosylase family protein n=1 Tax=Brachybacterium nesterenkovii TaxID=47847 RepID=UPI00321BEF8A